MNLFTQSMDYLLSLAPFFEWSQMQDVAKGVFAKSPKNCYLPVLACEAVGAPPELAIHGLAAITCLQIGIVLIDDILDADPRGLYRQIGTAAAANLASAFQATGLEAIIHSRVNPKTKLAILAALNKMVHKTALGQYWDVRNLATEEDYWYIVRTKSSPFFEAGLQMGALLGGASLKTAEKIGKLGAIYGEMIQLHDDINDAMEVPANPDWLSGRQSLPLLFASTVDHPGRERFLVLRQAVTDADALGEAQLILIRCGAVSYVVHELLQRHQEARKMLERLVLPNGRELELLFEEIIAPVYGLLSEVEGR